VDVLSGDPHRLLPSRADAPDAPDAEHDTLRLNATIHEEVVSDSLTQADTAPWTDTTEIVRRADAADRIAELKKRGRRHR
jgi:hypothetical protein